MADFESAEATATELESVVDSAIAVIEGIADEIAEAVAANDAGDNTKLASLESRLRAKKEALAAAIEANTPSEPPA